MVNHINDLKKYALYNALQSTPENGDKKRGEYSISSALTKAKITCFCYDLLDFTYHYTTSDGRHLFVDENFVKGYIAGMEV